MKPLSADLRRHSPKTTAADVRRGMVVPDPAPTGYPISATGRLTGANAERWNARAVPETESDGREPHHHSDCGDRRRSLHGLGDVGRAVINRVSFGSVESPTGGQSRYTNVEKVFGVLMIVTASGMAFAHGSNDVANAIGPVAAIVGVVTTGEVASKSTVPAWILLVGAAGIVVGLATFGYRVMATIGRKITELTPSRGFAAEFAAASTVVVASGTGLPVSTTQTLVGAVLGVGLARGTGALDFGVVRTIIVSWVVTLPVGAVLAVAFYYILSLAMAWSAG